MAAALWTRRLVDLLGADPDTFARVIGDRFLPWRTGEGRLYTLEHHCSTRASLKPGGMFCQWLPMYHLTRSQYEIILRTFTTVFPEAFLIRGDFYAERPIVGLVGGRPLETFLWSTIEAACASLREARNTTDPLVRHAEGVAMLVVEPLMQPEGEPLITLVPVARLTDWTGVLI